jgi:hypothetical protein
MDKNSRTKEKKLALTLTYFNKSIKSIIKTDKKWKKLKQFNLNLTKIM